MNAIPFTKLHGCGNDFVAIDNRNNTFSLNQIIELTPALCHRKFGIGADGVLLLNPPTKANTHFEMIYRNADGSDAGMCGNGGRCIAKFASSLGMGQNLNFSVHNGLYSAFVNDQEVHLSWLGLEVLVQKINVEGNDTVFQLYTGTDHVVLFDQDLTNSSDLVKHGRSIRYNTVLNPNGTNVNFVAPVIEETNDRQKLRVVTYERGVEDLTLACGTGALASSIAWHFARSSKQTDNAVLIEMPGGILTCSFTFNSNSYSYEKLQLTASATIVYSGVYHA